MQRLNIAGLVCVGTLCFTALSKPAAADATGITVAQPLAGQTTSTQVTYTATATTNSCAKGFASMGIYVDNQLAYVVDGKSLDIKLTLQPGSHYTVVQAWDYCGGASMVALPITVQAATTNSAPAPAPTPASTSTTTLTGGAVNKVVLNGTGFTKDTKVTVDGKAVTTTFLSDKQVQAQWFLAPWKEGSVQVGFQNCANCSGVTLPIAPTKVSFDAAARFTSQVAMGPRPEYILRVQKLGFESYIDEQIATPGYQYVTSADTSYGASFQRQMDQIAIRGQSPLRFKVAYTLQTFITNGALAYPQTWAPWQKTLEADAFGNFRTIMDDISSSPLMATFLNLANNWAATDARTQPNENFGRELMQLFTLGQYMLNEDGTQKLDPSGRPIPAYDQDTVRAMSRAFTGWTYPKSVDPRFTSGSGVDYSLPLVGLDNKHDHGAKTLFGNVTLPAGLSIDDDRKAALDALFNHPNLPPYVSRILIQKLVTSNPSPEYVNRVVQVFKNDGRGVRGNMAAVIKAILLDPEARQGDTSPRAEDGVLRDTVSLIIGTQSTLQIEGGDDRSFTLPTDLGQALWGAPNVFYYYPPTHLIPGTKINSPEAAQLTAFSDVNRTQVLWSMISGQLPGVSSPSYCLSSWLFVNFPALDDFVDALDHVVYHGAMSPQVKAKILQVASSLPQNPTDGAALNIIGVYQRMGAAFLAINANSSSVIH